MLRPVQDTLQVYPLRSQLLKKLPPLSDPAFKLLVHLRPGHQKLRLTLGIRRNPASLLLRHVLLPAPRSPEVGLNGPERTYCCTLLLYAW